MLAAIMVAGIAPVTAIADDRFTVVSIGDSFASGEGNPSIPGQHNNTGLVVGSPEIWATNDSDAQRCHRSPRAHGSVAVGLLRERFPSIPIEFVHVACSGATITDGLLGSYVGVEPDGRPAMEPQLSQVDAALAEAGVAGADALVVNIGVNDIGFGDLLTDCLAFAFVDCSSMEGRVDETEGRLAGLSDRFRRLREAVVGADGASAPLDAIPGRVYLVEYPDPTTDDAGELCHRAPSGDILDRISRTESGWVSEDVVPALNGQVRGAVDSARAMGLAWEYVGGNVAGFDRHGFCADDRFMNTNGDAVAVQGADAVSNAILHVSNGIVHPNNAGHADVATRVADAIAQQIEQEYAAGTPALAVRSATARATGVPESIELVWTSPGARPVARYELEIRRAQTPGSVLRLQPLSGDRREYAHEGIDGTGAYLFRIRACAADGDCSPFSSSVRASNVAPAQLATPTGLRRAPGSGPLSGRVVELRWDRADDRWSRYELEHRRLPRPGDRHGDPLTARQQDTLRKAQRGGAPESVLLRGGGVRDLTSPLLELRPFTTITTATESATIGSALAPLGPADSYEVRVRACSDVGCTAPTPATVEPVTRPSQRVGDFELDRAQRLVAPGLFPLDVRGELRAGARDLDRVEVRISGDGGEIGRVAYDPRADRLSLSATRQDAPARNGPGRAQPRSRPPARLPSRSTGRPGTGTILRAGDLALDARRSAARLRGRQIHLRLAVRLGAGLSGERLGVEVAAASRRARQGFAPAGAILVRER